MAEPLTAERRAAIRQHVGATPFNETTLWYHKDVADLLAALTAAEQMMWDAYAILGFDTDGDPTPRSVGGWPDSFLDHAREARKDYDDACTEACDAMERAEKAETERDQLCEAVRERVKLTEDWLHAADRIGWSRADTLNHERMRVLLASHDQEQPTGTEHPTQHAWEPPDPSLTYVPPAYREPEET